MPSKQAQIGTAGSMSWESPRTSQFAPMSAVACVQGLHMTNTDLSDSRAERMCISVRTRC